MSPRWWLLWMLLCAAGLALVASESPAWAQAPDPGQAARAADEAAPAAEPEAETPKPAAGEAEARIRQALLKPVSVDFHETPLDVAAAFLEDTCGIPILLDSKALSDVGVERNEPVSLQVKDVSLRSALRLMLLEADLTFVIRNEVLMITTPEEAENESLIRAYPVGDIVGTRVGPDEVGYDYDSLIDMLTCCVEPGRWGRSGPGPVHAADFVDVKALVISEMYDVHEEVASLLAALRHVAQQAAEGKRPDSILFDRVWPVPPAYDVISRALGRKISFSFEETPLQEAIDYLRKTADVNVISERGALADVDIPEDAPVSARGEDVTLDAALRLVLRDLDLTYLPWDEVILITTREEAAYRFTLGVYPVGDLVARQDDSGQTACDFSLLEKIITEAARAASWDDVGGPGSMAPAPFDNIHALVISQTRDVHQEIATVLAGLRSIAQRAAEGPLTEPVMLDEVTGERAAAVQAIQKALAQQVSFDFVEVSLLDVLDHLKKTLEIDIQVDIRVLDDWGIPTDTPVTIRVSGITLRSALALILDPLDLTWVIDDGVLLITTPEEAETRPSIGIYPVGDLVVCRDENDKLWDDYDSLIEVITSSAAMESWEGLGGPGSMTGGMLGAAKVLVVHQTRQGHEEVCQLLRDLRHVAATSGKDNRPPRRSRPQPLPPPEGSRMGGGFF